MCSYDNCSTAGCSGNSLVPCISCPDGFYLGDTGLCYQCNNNCKYISKFSCIECLRGYYGTSNFCENLNCISCTTALKCTECIAGKYGHACNSDCIKLCTDGKCNKDSGTCLQQCASNEYLDSGVCKSCPSRCARCANSTHCTVCDTYYRWGLVCEYDCTACYSNCNKDAYICIYAYKQCCSHLHTLLDHSYIWTCYICIYTLLIVIGTWSNFLHTSSKTAYTSTLFF